MNSRLLISGCRNSVLTRSSGASLPSLVSRSIPLYNQMNIRSASSSSGSHSSHTSHDEDTKVKRSRRRRKKKAKENLLLFGRSARKLPFEDFHPPHVSAFHKYAAIGMGATFWLWIFWRFKQDWRVFFGIEYPWDSMNKHGNDHHSSSSSSDSGKHH